MYNGYTESQAQTESRRARMEGWTQQREIMKQVIADVSPRLNLFLEVCGDIDAGNGELFPIESNGVDAVDAQRWQDEQIELAGRHDESGGESVNVSQYFNGYKATATKEWAKRHLNES